jgi:hypothetical protein
MSVDSKNRTGRPVQIRGQFINCRHHSSTDPTKRTFHCAKYKTQKTNCEGCHTCPKCDSILFTFRLVQSRGRDCIHAEHDKSCVICGAYIEENLRLPLIRITEHKPEDACQVHGCKHTAYEGHQHLEEVDGHQVSFRICESHRRRIKTWRLHPNKGEDQRPIIFEHGQLVDNPEYTKKQGKHRKDQP